MAAEIISSEVPECPECDSENYVEASFPLYESFYCRHCDRHFDTDDLGARDDD